MDREKFTAAVSQLLSRNIFLELVPLSLPTQGSSEIFDSGDGKIGYESRIGNILSSPNEDHNNPIFRLLSSKVEKTCEVAKLFEFIVSSESFKLYSLLESKYLAAYSKLS